VLAKAQALLQADSQPTKELQSSHHYKSSLWLQLREKNINSAMKG